VSVSALISVRQSKLISTLAVLPAICATAKAKGPADPEIGFPGRASATRPNGDKDHAPKFPQAEPRPIE
jgi:hypothetical protein